MTLCKICGTVYDEFYGVCPRCGTPCQDTSDTTGSLPPLGGMNQPAQNPSAPGYLPPIDIAIQNSGDPSGTPTVMPPLGQAAPTPPPVDPDATIPVPAVPSIDPDATIPVQRPIDPDATIPVQRPIDPDATIPVQRPLDPDATIPVQRPIDPDATIPVQRPIDPDATIPVQRPLDPDATIPVQRPLDPDATIPVQRPIDPDATIPVQRPIDPDATIPVQRPINPDATIPVQRPIDPDATVPVARTPLQPPMPTPAPINPISQTQDVPPIGNTNPGQYGDDYNVGAVRTVTPPQPPKKKGSAGKVIAIILIVAVVLGGCGVGAYFLFFHNKNNPQEPPADPQTSDTSTTSDTPAPATDPDSLRAGARSMNMAVMNLYAGITNGSINADSPSNELRGLAPEKLPRAGATDTDREAAADAMTIRDVVTYAQSSDRFTDATIGYYVYAGAQVYYQADAAGTPLTFETTIGQIRSAPAEPSQQPSVPESSVEESSQPAESSQPTESSEPSEVSEPSESSVEPPVDHDADAALLTATMKDLYSAVVSGTLTKKTPTAQRNGLAASKLPPASASTKERAAYADSLTVRDAIRYGGLTTTFSEETIGDYGYRDNTVYYQDAAATPLTPNTTLGDIFRHETPEPSQPSTPESSVEESSQPESSIEESSVPQSSAEVSQNTDPMMAQLAGKWEMTFNTEKYSEEELASIRSDIADEFVILLNADGTCSSYMVKDGKTDVLGSGTWEIDDHVVSVTIDGDTELFSYRDGHLNTAAWGDIAFFAKA